MEFQWLPEHVGFRRRLREVLIRELPADWEAQTQLDNSCEFAVSFARRFCPILADEGLLIPHWARENGGAGLDAYYHWILGEEMWAVGEPRSYQYMNVNWVGPAFLKYGSQWQRDEHLSRIAAGTVFYCQGFSEPDAGSDLASLRTTAARRDGHYVISGSKLWTSAASFADFCILLARTGAAGRDGISVFVLPMDAKGVTVRPIASLQGKRSFHAIFLDKVEVESAALLGTENGGWSIVRDVLANERIGSPRYALAWRGLARAVDWLIARGRFSDGATRVMAARARAALQAARLLALRVVDGRVKKKPDGADTHVARFAAAAAERMVCDFLSTFALDLVAGNADPVVAAAYRRAGSAGIAAGSAEIQLNLIARGFLGLPSERAPNGLQPN
jgi:alkylation response protein AidB-like acyl-CoA dehydrogenase